MVGVRVDVKRMLVLLRGVERRMSNMAPALRSFGIYTDKRTQGTYRALRHGGWHRGVYWPNWAPQYLRKTDGVLVEAWGGVRKLHGRGMVKGRKRPSGKRVTRQSNLLRDTGALRAASLHNWRISRHRMRGTVRKDYGRKLAEKRPFFFWQRNVDDTYFRELCADFIMGRKRNESAPVGSLLEALGGGSV